MVERDAKSEKIRRDACPVMCCIGDGKSGACDRHANEGDQLIQVGPLTIPQRRVEDGGRIVPFLDGVRGIATSGWCGRGHSLGIADAVTVLAPTAACAGAVATLIANAVNLPDSPKIARRPAVELAPDSDLGGRAVTVNVARLSEAEIDDALADGSVLAQSLCDPWLISSAYLSLRDRHCTVANRLTIPAVANGNLWRTEIHRNQ